MRADRGERNAIHNIDPIVRCRYVVAHSVEERVCSGSEFEFGWQVVAVARKQE